jgi:putative photosynthetic complex assembly protein 2
MTVIAPYALTVAATLVVWWFSTGIIVYLDGLPKRTYRWSFGAMTVLATAAVAGLAWSAGEANVIGAAVAFGCAILVWGWNEMGFLMGYITGPRPEPCPPQVTEGERFAYATMALLYHEVAIVASLGLIALVTSGQPNQFGLWTFALLWLLRLSAKFNLFLGVPNRTEEFLPEGLSYLKSYFRRANMNPLLPVSITAGTIVCVLLAQRAGASAAVGFEATGYTFLATLLALAVLEHWLMIVPLPASSLWGWGLASHEETARENERVKHGAANARACDVEFVGETKASII